MIGGGEIRVDRAIAAPAAAWDANAPQAGMSFGMHEVDGVLTASTAHPGTAIDAVLSVRQGCGSRTELVCADDDGDLFYVLTNGHGDMPGEGEDRLSEKVRWNMILYLRSLAS